MLKDSDMIRKYVITVLLVAYAAGLSAQRLRTTVVEQYLTSSEIDQTHLFNVGDKVSLIGYKKKSGLHHFAVVADGYAEIFSYPIIPFNVTEKELKKLPNALSDEMRDAIKQIRTKIVSMRYAERKQHALEGRIRVVVPKSGFSYSDASQSLYPEAGALGKVEAGDTIHVLGYAHSYADHKIALYSDKAVGVFYTLSKRPPFEGQLETNYLPSIDDADVCAVIKQKQSEWRRRQEEDDARFREDALRGNISVVLKSVYDLKAEDGTRVPFASGDTVSVFGYKSESPYDYFALASEKGAGIYKTLSSLSYLFRNTVEFSRLLSTDDPKVKAEVERRQAKADSIKEAEARKMQEELVELKKRVIGELKAYDPVLVHVTNWTMNSVGEVEVNITVTNGSPTETIKYITFQAYFTNPVGDRVRNEIGGGTTWKARGVGPIGPRPTTLENIDERWENFRGSYEFDNGSFYSSMAQYINISSVTIQYMSGKTITLTGEKLKKCVLYGED